MARRYLTEIYFQLATAKFVISVLDKIKLDLVPSNIRKSVHGGGGTLVCRPERSNGDLTNRWHDRIPEVVPRFRSLKPLRSAKTDILLITGILLT